ncbi:carbonic anhydrase [Salinisphaera sp. Q1T1-3]|uniref:carbonic anhydrase n=1 Tax=Salinisphaera sp. Q1T1-3 TaxID=2321229 RepID=UPI000E71399E|nr:carbonic anhydrase [Salinisphaera sp. Q1T1-3]RJS91626.1 carbonic anhydrase [Salinisphaera sp. Q1T1-3]
MQFKERLLLENRAWSETMSDRDPEFFSRLRNGQSPEAFWLGCSDSRVPAEQLSNASPGDLFVHRNVANVAAIADDGFMSALEYAIGVLEVRYLIVCGHEGCGGIGAACSGQPTGMPHVDAHLSGVTDMCRGHAGPDVDTAAPAHVNAMVHHNVARQAAALAELALVREARVKPTVLGLVYAIDRGTLECICEHKPHDGPLSRVA